MASIQETGTSSFEDGFIERFCTKIEKKKKPLSSWKKLNKLQKETLLTTQSDSFRNSQFDAPECNVLSYAIHHENYDLVLHILEEDPDVTVNALQKRDGNGNNALQKLIWSAHNRRFQTREKEDIVQSIFKRMLDVCRKQNQADVLVGMNKRNENALLQSLKPQNYGWRQEMFQDLLKCLRTISPLKFKKALTTKYQICHCEDSSKRSGSDYHQTDCPMHYNLLMYAIEYNDRKNTVYMQETLSGLEKDEKCQCILNSKKKIYNEAPNSVRLAAHKQNFTLLEELLEMVMQDENPFTVLLAWDNRLETALKWVFQSDTSVVWNSLLKISSFKEKFEESLRDGETLALFLEHEMSVSTIAILNSEIEAFKTSFALPKPSSHKELARPFAMICHNTFSQTPSKTIAKTKNSAEELHGALKKLGWPIEPKHVYSEWTADDTLRDLIKQNLEETKSSASIILICIISHGQNDEVAGISKSGQKNDYNFTFIDINKIVQVVAQETHSAIPKLIIMDCCRTQTKATISNATLRENNITLLLSTGTGQRAQVDLYTTKLAEEMKKIESPRSIESLHRSVAEEVKRKRQLKLNEGDWTELKKEEKIKHKNRDSCDTEADGYVTLEEGLEVRMQDFVLLTYNPKTRKEMSYTGAEFKSKQIPELINTARKIRLRKYGRDRTACRECQKDIKFQSYIPCENCSSCLCIDCAIKVQSDDDNLKTFLEDASNQENLRKFLDHCTNIRICCKACSRF